MGNGFPRSSIIASASLVTLCLFYVYSASTFAAVRIYPLIDRITYYDRFGVYITNGYIDHIIVGLLLILWVAFSLRLSRKYNVAIAIFAAFFATSAILNNDQVLAGITLSSLPAIIILLIYNHYSSTKILTNHSSELTLNYLVVLGIIIGVMGLMFAFAPVFSSHPLSVVSVRNYSYDLFLIFSSLSPVLLLLLIACVPIKLLLNFLTDILKPGQEPRILEDCGKGKRLTVKSELILLSLVVLLSIIVVLIPHLPTINKDNQQVGVDTGAYVVWLNTLKESGTLPVFLKNVFVEQSGGDRPISLIFLFTLHTITKVDPFYVVEYSPLVLAPALVITMYFLVRQLTSSNLTSLIASFLTAVSFHTLIGIYAGYYANWFALIPGYLAFLFLFRFLNKGGYKNLIFFGALNILLLFSHVYTWSILALVQGIVLIIMIVRPTQAGARRSAIILLIAVLFTVAIDAAKMSAFGTSSGIDKDVRLAGVFTGFDQFASRWNNLSYTTISYVGGQFANFLIFGLGLYWLFSSTTQNQLSIFIMVFLTMGILPFLIGEYTIQARVFYDIPFQLPAAIAVTRIINQGKSFSKSAPIFLWLIAAAVIAVSNYYFVAPS